MQEKKWKAHRINIKFLMVWGGKKIFTPFLWRYTSNLSADWKANEMLPVKEKDEVKRVKFFIEFMVINNTTH